MSDRHGLIGKRATVSWVDTTNMATWLAPDELVEFATDGAWKCKNTGWISHLDHECVVISARRSDSGHWGLSERIPHASIIRMKIHGEV